MGGPKINKSYKKLKNRLGRRANKAKQRGGGKALRKKKFRIKQAKNIEKKLLRYYGEMWKGNIDPTKEKENEEISRGRKLNLSGKKLRKLRKRSQSRHRVDGGMEVEISQKTDENTGNSNENTVKTDENTVKTDENTGNDKDNKNEHKEQSPDNEDDDWEDVDMEDGSDEEADDDQEEA